MYTRNLRRNRIQDTFGVKKDFDSTRTRTENLLLRRQAPYPLGHRAMVGGTYISFILYFFIL